MSDLTKRSLECIKIHNLRLIGPGKVDYLCLFVNLHAGGRSLFVHVIRLACAHYIMHIHVRVHDSTRRTPNEKGCVTAQKTMMRVETACCEVVRAVMRNK